MNWTLCFSINIIISIYGIIKGRSILLYNQGVGPLSYATADNCILTIYNSGYINSRVNGEIKSSMKLFHSIHAVVQFRNESFVGFSGIKLFWFDKDGLLMNEVDFTEFSQKGIVESSTIAIYSETELLLSGIVNKEINIALIDNHHQVIASESFTFKVNKHIACEKRFSPVEGAICGFMMIEEPKTIGILIMDKTMAKVDMIQLTTMKGDTLQMRRLNEPYFLACYLDLIENDINCVFYNDKTMTLGKSFLVTPDTQNKGYYQMEMIQLNSKEAIVIYAYNNEPLSIKIQKVNYQGELIKAPIVYPINEMDITNINYLKFNIGLQGIVYGSSPSLIYYLQIDVSSCNDYCGNVPKASETQFQLFLYSTSIIIVFTSEINTGILKQLDQVVIPNEEYMTTLDFTFFSEDSIGLVSATFHSVFLTGSSSECRFNLFVGVKAKCKCTSVYYVFQDQCIDSCPYYTFTDETIKECINCALSGQYLYERKCRPDIPSNTYISNIEYNVLTDCTPPCLTCTGIDNSCLSCPPYDTSCKLLCSDGYYQSIIIGQCDKCYETCATCSGPDAGTDDNHNCDTCLIGYDLFSPKQCYKTCNDINTSRWYIDNNKQFHCIPSTICPSVRPIYVKETNQCVESCSKLSSCIYCQLSPQALLNYTNTCVTECPINTVVNAKTYTCEEPPKIEIDITDKPVDDVLNDLNNTISKPGTIIKGDDWVIEISNSSDKESGLNSSRIDLGECENILRKQYNIPSKIELIILKLELDRKNEVTNQIEYEVYDNNGNKLNLSYCNEVKVDITSPITNSSSLDIEKAKEFEEKGIDIYNPDDPFFTDICFPYTTENGVDIPLKDRIKDVYQNVSVCEESCTYKEMDLDQMTVTCSCDVKPQLNTEINSNFFLDAFTSAFTDSNFEVITCSNLIFDKAIIVKNIGFWLYLVLILLHLPPWIYYFIYGSASIVKYMKGKSKPNPPKRETDYIDRIIQESGSVISRSERMRQRANIKYFNNDDDDFEVKVQKKLNNSLNLNHSQNPDTLSLGKSRFFGLESKKSLFKSVNVKTLKENQEQNLNEISFKNNNNNSIYIDNIDFNIVPTASKDEETLTNIKSLGKRRDSSNSIVTYNSNFILQHYDRKPINYQKKLIIPLSEKIDLKYNDPVTPTQTKKSMFAIENNTAITAVNPETQNTLGLFTEKANTVMKKIKPSMEVLDDFDLPTAIINDNRSFWRLLYICLKTRHPILCTFVKEYNLSLRIIIIIQFLFGNIMDFAFNALFYSDDLISKRYNYEGTLGFLFTLQNTFTIAVSSFALSFVVSLFLNLLSTSESRFEALLKTKKTNKKYDMELKRAFLCFKIKLAFFMILEILLTLFFWYYVIAFCAVYQNSQMSWFTGGLTSFAISLLIPIPISLAIILVRILALKHQINWLFRFVNWVYKI